MNLVYPFKIIHLENKFDMKKITDIKVVHKICLDEANAMHEVLTRHHIPYFMAGGTLLGAIRHKGFIPWDDDMDFGIMREFFPDAIKFLKAELPEPYKCISLSDHDSCLFDSCKIVDTKTLIKQDDNYNKDPLGIFIDLFPIDYSDGKSGFFSNYMFQKTLVRIQNFRFTNVVGRNKFLKVLSYIIKLILHPLHKETIPRIMRKVSLKSGKFVINNCGVYGKKEIMPADIIGKCLPLTFEDTKLLGVEKPDEYLKYVYGDYMELPPEDKRRVHLKNIELIEE